MADFYMGYVVELAEKKGLFEAYGDLQKVLCSRKKLVELLVEGRYLIQSARFVDVVQYRMNHPEEKLEEWGIKR